MHMYVHVCICMYMYVYANMLSIDNIKTIPD